MSDDNNAWFHCGRCGSLFQSEISERAEGRRCSVCGEDPEIGIERRPSAATRAMAAFARPEMLAPVEGAVRREEGVGRERRREKTNYFAAKLVGVWLVLLLAVIVLLKWGTGEESEEERPGTRTTAAEDADAGVIREALPKISECLEGFFLARTPEEKNQFVADPVGNAGRMARFYSTNPMGSVDLKALTYNGAQVLPVDRGKAILTHWKTAGGEVLDAVFYKEKGQWRLDWPHFVRYSEEPWTIFLAESGTAVAEFRLLAREGRLIDEGNTDTMKLLFYAPRFGHPSDLGSASPEFVIDAHGTAGRKLKAAMEALSKEREAGALPNIDPDGLIRVRVKIRRTENGNERVFELDELLATDWLSGGGAAKAGYGD